MGWVTWVVLGLLFSFFRWRKGLLLFPLVMMFVLLLVPAVQDRLFQDMDTNEGSALIEDASTVTSGRTVAWPFVIDSISERP